MKHTPTPWRAGKIPDPIRIYSNDRTPIASLIELLSPDTDQANAARIVSCVNALEGIENPAAIKEIIAAASAYLATSSRVHLDRLAKALANLKKEQWT